MIDRNRERFRWPTAVERGRHTIADRVLSKVPNIEALSPPFGELSQIRAFEF